jgi:hypothetical protein
MTLEEGNILSVSPDSSIPIRHPSNMADEFSYAFYLDKVVSAVWFVRNRLCHDLFRLKNSIATKECHSRENGNTKTRSIENKVWREFL